MKNILNKLILITVVVVLLSSYTTAQVNSDSIRIVNEALKMINFPEPKFTEPFVANPTPKEIADLGFEQLYESKPIKFSVRDGLKIHAQKYNRNSNKTVLLLHGALASSYSYNKMSGLLREALNAEVITIDLRGHGQSEGKIGDVENQNQYAEDLDDIISQVKKNKPNQNIILTGHSMGGGIILKYVETFSQESIDGYLLFAPNLGNTSPTINQKLDLKNNFVKMHLSRGLGIKMLNEFGIHNYDSLKIVYYNLPAQMPLKSYSYRSMQAGIPENYKMALRSIKKPLLVLAGSDDDVFIAEEYKVVINSYSNGECHIIESETHNGIRHHESAFEKVSNWAKTKLK